ncbi:MAG: alanine dehydrogenase [Firmicutes bacterium]|nr:alanine dehydrogenase [Bacillota bacterium]MBR3212810.1 alanine dehydrogenase [Bacillota bacterium]
MKFGVLKDIKNGEFRVVCTPAEVSEIVRDGHEVYVASNAGYQAGFDDEEYEKAGAKILATNEEIWAECEFVAKVKEIEPCEYDLMREGQMIYCCIHPAAHREEVDALLEKKVIAITAEDSHRYGSPNCEAAGKAGAFMGLWAMMSNNGGCGKFANGLGAAPGVRALVCGAGTVGKAAIEVLHNMGCTLTVADINIGLLRQIGSMYDASINTCISNRYNLTREVAQADLVINSVRWPKNATEYMITRDMVKSMHRGAVIVDISNDYGCIETFHPTTHDDPIYIEEGVVHYCVENIPGAIAGSTSVSYAAGILQHFRSIMNNGLEKAMVKDGFLRRSLTAYKGYLTHEETSGIQGRPWVRPEVILGIENENLDPAPRTTVTTSDNFYPEFAK